MSDHNLESVRRVYEQAWNENNLSVLDECISPDYVDHEAPPGLSHGIAETKTLFTFYRQIFEGVRFDVEQYISNGEYVTARVLISGIHKGDFYGQKATGKPVKMRGIDVFRVADGKLVEHWGAMTTDSFAQFFLPPPPPA